MIISEVSGNTDCQRIEVASLEEAARLMTQKTISTNFFKGDRKVSSNFEGSDFIALDVDGGCSLKEASLIFKSYENYIMTTKSHGKEKKTNGGEIIPACDRFRILLKLDKRITNKEDYKATYESLIEKFPFVDTACKDPARQFYASPGTPKYNKGGSIQVVKHVIPIKPQVVKSDTIKGKLANATYKFIASGASNGEWNKSLNAAVYDLRQNGYSIDESTELLKKATGHLDEADQRVIKSAYEAEMRFEPRGLGDNPFKFVKIGELLKTDEKVEWLVDGILTKGGFSLLAGKPKSGKSTLVRQLTKATATGGEFLGRKVVKGKILYLALEEQAAMLKDQFNKVGITDDHDVTIHVGSVNGAKRFEYLKQYCIETKPDLVIIDTLFLFAQFENGNDYGGTNDLLRQIREIPRESGCHMLCIHHTNKGEAGGTNSIMGSNSIHGSVDCAIIFDQFGQERSITTSQRGGKPFFRQKLQFLPEHETYVISKEPAKKEREF